MLRCNDKIQFSQLKSCRKLIYLATERRYDFEESIVAGYTEDARAEVNQRFEYVGNSVPMLKRSPCEQHVVYNIITPVSSSTLC